MWNYVIFAAAILMLSMGVGEYISAKTKGIFGSILVLSLIYLIGYQVGIIPDTTPVDTGIIAIAGNFGTLMIITNLGTMINLKQLINEYRTVAIAVVALVLMGSGFITIGSVLFGKEYALCAYPPVAGAAISAQMVVQAANEAGIPVLAGFAALLVSLQTFVAIPIAGVCLNKYAADVVKTGKLEKLVNSTSDKEEKFDFRVIKKWPEGFNTPNMMAGKVALVATLATVIGKATGIPGAVLALVLGVIFNELGFLDDNALQKAGYFNLCMLGLVAAILPSFAVLSISDIMSLIVPIVFFLLLGVVCLGLGGGLVGKFVFKYDFRLSAALGMCAMIGFPFTMILSNDVVNGMKLPEEQAQRMTDVILPKMVISGFVSVTVCSVIIASIVVPYI